MWINITNYICYRGIAYTHNHATTISTVDIVRAHTPVCREASVRRRGKTISYTKKGKMLLKIAQAAKVGLEAQC